MPLKISARQLSSMHGGQLIQRRCSVKGKCAERGPVIPRVAFLFMTRGTVVHEAMWKEWFRSALFGDLVLTERHKRNTAPCLATLGLKNFLPLEQLSSAAEDTTADHKCLGVRRVI